MGQSWRCKCDREWPAERPRCFLCGERPPAVAAGVTTNELDYLCRGCKRALRATRAKILHLIATKRTSCPFCGGEVDFPADLVTLVKEARPKTTTLPGGRDPAKPVSWSCETCARSFTSTLGELVFSLVGLAPGVGWTCGICAKGYTFPDEVRATALELREQLRSQGRFAPIARRECPMCLRPAVPRTADIDEVLACGLCGAPFRAGKDGEAWRPPRDVAQAASVESVRLAIGRMPRDEAGTVAGEALVARAARGELAVGEAENLVEIHDQLSAWRPEPNDLPPFLPLPVEDALVVIPALLFSGLVAHRDRGPDGAPEVVVALDRRTVLTSVGLTAEGVSAIASKVVGHVAAHFTGFWVDVRPRGEALKIDTRESVRRLRVALHESDRGVQLALAEQLDDAAPVPANEAMHRRLCEALAKSAPAMRSYFVLVALFGA